MRNIWNYILNFYPEGPKPFLKTDVLLTLLYKVGDLLEKEPSIIDLNVSDVRPIGTMGGASPVCDWLLAHEAGHE